MTTEYDNVIAQATEQLKSAMRSPNQPTVYAVHTTEKQRGRLIISDTAPKGVEVGKITVIRPIDTPAAVSGDWRHVPYSHVYQTLWNACRHAPILNS